MVGGLRKSVRREGSELVERRGPSLPFYVQPLAVNFQGKPLQAEIRGSAWPSLHYSASDGLKMRRFSFRRC